MNSIFTTCGTPTRRRFAPAYNHYARRWCRGSDHGNWISENARILHPMTGVVDRLNMRGQLPGRRWWHADKTDARKAQGAGDPRAAPWRTSDLRPQSTRHHSLGLQARGPHLTRAGAADRQRNGLLHRDGQCQPGSLNQVRRAIVRYYSGSLRWSLFRMDICRHADLRLGTADRRALSPELRRCTLRLLRLPISAVNISWSPGLGPFHWLSMVLGAFNLVRHARDRRTAVRHQSSRHARSTAGRASIPRDASSGSPPHSTGTQAGITKAAHHGTARLRADADSPTFHPQIATGGFVLRTVPRRPGDSN